MDTLRKLLQQPSSHTSCFVYRRRPLGGSEGNEMGGTEMKPDQPEPDEDLEAEPNSDITALVVQQPQHRRKTVIYLFLCSLLIFTTAFLLGYVAFRGSCHYCGEVGEMVPVEDKPGIDHYPTAGMYPGELRDMLKKYLQDEKIEATIRTTHPSGSSEGTALAAEILEMFKDLHMDHTWTDSHYATLQFPSRTQRNSLWIVDAEGEEMLEEIPLEDPDSYCAYSAIGTATGGLVYVNYGRQEDFDWLRSAGVSVIGCVVMMRVGGGVSYAEKVLFAQKAGAGGALIYPDPADIPQDPRRLGLNSYTAISEHVHLGSGDPFTPGFPSFNHTQFPPTQSSGLPVIPVQPISANVASKLLSQLSGLACPRGWQGRLPYVRCVLGPGFSSGDGRKVRMGVYNIMKPTLLNNIFSSLEGRIEPDQYIIMGAQRDAWGPGAVKSGVGTAVLLELARTFSHMGYLSMLHLKAVAYFSLDQAVMGDDNLSAFTSPLLADLVESTIKLVTLNTHRHIKSLYLNSGAYSFTAFGGVPAMELRFTEESRVYPFINTPLDTIGRLQEVLGGRLGVVGRSLAELVGLMVLRLAHDHILPLQITSYSQSALHFSTQLNKYSAELQARGLSPQWVFSARGDYSRAAKTLKEDILNSDIQDETMIRIYNTRIMRVEYYFLSQYVSVVETPFRHVLHGRGEHTLSALSEHLSLLTSDPRSFNEARFRRQLALFTWTLQGAANALSGDVWNIDNVF
uniref:PA domain-containing protein n=1 Tax=Esox lucius TaxID=8010 RepID=A0AAY5L6R9_ESOLU